MALLAISPLLPKLHPRNVVARVGGRARSFSVLQPTAAGRGLELSRSEARAASHCSCGDRTVCLPNGTPDGECRKWFSFGTVTGAGNPDLAGGKVTCQLFDDGVAHATAPGGSFYVPAGDRVCIPDGTAEGLCRHAFGRCRARGDGRVTPPPPPPPTGDGCSDEERANANAFGCDCKDGKPFGGYCEIGVDGCNVVERQNANAVGCDCKHGGPFGGYCEVGSDGCNVAQRESANRYGCNCRNGQPFGGHCEVGPDGCNVAQREAANRFGCDCKDGKSFGGFCTLGPDNCTDEERN